MTLGFTQQIDKKPNFFIEKIWESIMQREDWEAAFKYPDYHLKHFLKLGKGWDGANIRFDGGIAPKLHTIREDKHNRWVAGMDIHFVINNRQKNRFQFAPILKCVSVQDVKIYNNLEGDFKVMVDGLHLKKPYVELLAINDGFNSVEEFKHYFLQGQETKTFEGKIIHWTKLKY